MYHGSDGEYYSAVELHRQYDAGRWKFCMGDSNDGRTVVQTETGELLTLTPLRGGTIGMECDAADARDGDAGATGANDPDGDAARETGASTVSYVPPVGHCRDCGEPLAVEPCLNCEARRRLDD